ncbi:Arm DNA-binding domain-containing protein [Phenylobacterium sp.]|uniref:Arm DNA-binding domain-containing protein n=1 Tax=Phenylobacterium sp. TaxID=1871053 RepID=UPI0039C998D2
MARTQNKLTARFVASVQKPGRHSDGAGLYLVVDRAGARRWAFLFRQDGRLKEMGLGSALSVSLRDAGIGEERGAASLIGLLACSRPTIATEDSPRSTPPR